MKFNKENVYFMWEDELDGKLVCFADDIPTLKEELENENFGICKKSKGEKYPFVDEYGIRHMFVYVVE